MGKIIFVTATDTEVGKTYVSSGLLRAANSRNLTTIGIKPVASGCVSRNGKLYNDDALSLQHSASCKLDYDTVNPFAFRQAIAPHLAAKDSDTELTVATLIAHTSPALAATADLHLIEGFGGWHAPLNARETMADYASQLNCEVLLVVGIRLGCINHAILTERAVTASGATCIGWIANIIDPAMSHQKENISTLQNWLQCSLLATIQHGQSAEQALKHLKIF